MEFFSEIKDIIVKELAVDEKEVLSEAHLQDDLGADSVALLNLAAAISDQYEIEILSDELVELENVDELVKLVETKVSSK